jgi:MoaA/NifB/PqqE/SkfB family radical SAM enzyme
MSLRNLVHQVARPAIARMPALKALAVEADARVDLWRHSVAQYWPGAIRPDPRDIFVTLTANCNLRCAGCRYGRDFMAGEQLPLQTVLDLLDDCSELGIKSIRLYGGEPLLHKDLPQMVERAVQLGLFPWLTTNGILLKDRIDVLYEKGLRAISMGFYGLGEEYNGYVHRKEAFARMEAGIAYTRKQYGANVQLVLAWLLMKPTCSVAAVRQALDFAMTYQAPMSVNLVHYSLPYFTEGPERELAFEPGDRERIVEVVEELIRFKVRHPEMLQQTLIGLRSIPDWLLRGPEMRVPCERYRLIWIGADGSVQLCYVTFKLGNLHEQRLRDLLFTPAHEQASRDAFQLNCPNCHCSFDTRTRLHGPSRREYGQPA